MTITTIQNKKYVMIVVIGAIIVLSSIFVVRFYDDIFYTSPYTGVGKLGSDHQHARFQLIIDDHRISFSSDSYPKYLDANPYILMEKEDGNTIHRFATGATLDIFFNSFGMKFSKDCIILPEDTRSIHDKDIDWGPAEYCNEGDKTLKFYVNKQPNDMYEQYVMNERDKILIIYGNQTEEVIDERLKDVKFPSGPSLGFFP